MPQVQRARLNNDYAALSPRRASPTAGTDVTVLRSLGRRTRHTGRWREKAGVRSQLQVLYNHRVGLRISGVPVPKPRRPEASRPRPRPFGRPPRTSFCLSVYFCVVINVLCHNTVAVVLCHRTDAPEALLRTFPPPPPSSSRVTERCTVN